MGIKYTDRDLTIQYNMVHTAYASYLYQYRYANDSCETVSKSAREPAYPPRALYLISHLLSIYDVLNAYSDTDGQL
jgi:hypothetical protein